MQRRLTDESTTFSDILDNVRQDLGKHYLCETRLSVERIAHLLDYSTTAPFTVAFERWTGTTPLRFRKSSGKSQQT